MHKIVYSEFVAPEVKKIVIEAPKIAEKRKAGQFIVLRVKDKGERIPLTIVDSDPQQGTITLIVQGIGKSTKELNSLNAGDAIEDLVGPLGKPSHIENFGTVVVVGGGVGTGVAYPTAVALKKAGNYTIGITGARTKDLIVLEDDLRKVCDETYVTTDDGTYGFHGFVTQKLEELLKSRKVDFVLTIGPLPMMKAVSNLTRKYNVHTMVSLNPLMVDGIGMCGGCRATVDNKPVFVCVDGPEFDAHLVDFDSLMKRNRAYAREEKIAVEAHVCASGIHSPDGKLNEKIVS
jgi:ferredoxin/flavodoxin---NADP+ reductase